MRLAFACALGLSLSACATMTETRSERIVAREFRGTRLERGELERVRATSRLEGESLRVTVLREDTCLVSSTEVQTVAATIEQKPGGVGFFAEGACLAVSVPVAVLYLPKQSDAPDPLGIGATRGTGALAAGAAALCGAAAVYDVLRAKDRVERFPREVPLAATPARCGPKPAAGARVILRRVDGTTREETTDERGEVTFAPPFDGALEATLGGRTGAVAPPR